MPGIARNLYKHPLPSPSDTPLGNPPSPPASPAPLPTVPSIKAFQNALWDTGSPEVCCLIRVTVGRLTLPKGFCGNLFH